MNERAELRKLRRLRRDIEQMDFIIENAEEYKRRLEDPSDEEVRGELSPYFDPDKDLGWRQHPVVHNYLRERLGVLNELKGLFERRFGPFKKNGENDKTIKPVHCSEEEFSGETHIAIKESDVPPFQKPGDSFRGGESVSVEKKGRDGGLTLYDVLEYYRSSGLVGEERLAIVQTLGAISKAHFGIESLSGSGKSFAADLLMELLPKGMVYDMRLSSKTAESYNAQEINRHRIIYIPELQKAMNNGNQIIVEALKDLTEGRDAQRKVRDQKTDSVKTYVIRAGKGIVFTLATENSLDYGAEFSRRVFVLHTDISPEQTDRILRSKAEQQYASGKKRERKNFRALQSHLRDCLERETEYVNPFAGYFMEFFPRDVRARSHDDYFYTILRASGLFYHRDRLDEGRTLFLSLEDAFSVYTVYWKQFCKSLLRFPILGEEILQRLESSEGPVTAQDMYLELMEVNPSVTYGVTEKSMEALAEGRFLKKKDYKSRRAEYYRTGTKPAFEAPVDWQECWEEGLGIMREHHPEVAARWASGQAEGGSVYATHPLIGERVKLADYNELREGGNGDGTDPGISQGLE